MTKKREQNLIELENRFQDQNKKFLENKQFIIENY